MKHLAIALAACLLASGLMAQEEESSGFDFMNWKPILKLAYRLNLEEGGGTTFHEVEAIAGLGYSLAESRLGSMRTTFSLAAGGTAKGSTSGEFSTAWVTFLPGFRAAVLPAISDFFGTEAATGELSVEGEIGYASAERADFGAAPGTAAASLGGTDGIRLGVRSEVGVLVGSVFAWYSADYFSSATLKDSYIGFKVGRPILPLAVSVGTRRLSVKNYHRTYFVLGLEYTF